ncbi:MAG: tetratricopeptide repeat protein [Clostridia bacterium]|nr:tetratricopeptide repeat protein [Clostridia bacterium]
MEKVLFFAVAFVMFGVLLSKFLKKKDTLYLYLLIINVLGILIRFVLYSNDVDTSFVLLGITYTMSIIIPLIVVGLEFKKVFLPEIFAVSKAKIFLKLGQNEQARKILIKFIEKHPNSYYSHKLLAEVYEKEGKLEEAIDEYVLAVDNNKKDYDSYYEIAFLLNQIEKQDEAKKMLQELIDKKPEYYKASDLLGLILYDQEQFREAANVYLQALKYNPDIYELYYGLGMVYTRLNDFQTAREYYEKAAQINSDAFHPKMSIAQIMMLQGELEEAEQTFLDCMIDKYSEPDAYFYLSIIYMLKGDRDRAVGYANIAIELDKRMYKRVSRQEIFAPVMKEIRSGKSKIRRNDLTKQEFRTRRHLEEMFALVSKMTNNGRTVDMEDWRAKKVKERAEKDFIDRNGLFRF